MFCEAFEAYDTFWIAQMIARMSDFLRQLSIRTSGDIHHRLIMMHQKRSSMLSRYSGRHLYGTLHGLLTLTRTPVLFYITVQICIWLGLNRGTNGTLLAVYDIFTLGSIRHQYRTLNISEYLTLSSSTVSTDQSIEDNSQIPFSFINISLHHRPPAPKFSARHLFFLGNRSTVVFSQGRNNQGESGQKKFASMIIMRPGTQSRRDSVTQ